MRIQTHRLTDTTEHPTHATASAGVFDDLMRALECKSNMATLLCQAGYTLDSAMHF